MDSLSSSTSKHAFKFSYPLVSNIVSDDTKYEQSLRVTLPGAPISKADFECEQHLSASEWSSWEATKDLGDRNSTETNEEDSDQMTHHINGVGKQ